MSRGVLVSMPCPEVFLIVFAPCSELVVRFLLSVRFFCHMDDGAANTHDIFVDPTTVSPVVSNILRAVVSHLRSVSWVCDVSLQHTV